MSLPIYITNPRYNPGIPSKSSVQPIEPIHQIPSKLPSQPSKKPTKSKQKQS